MNRSDRPEFRDKVLTYSKSEKHIPVGATDTDREVYIRENDVSASLYHIHMKARAFFIRSFVMKTDIGRMKRFWSPSKLWKETKKWYHTSTIRIQNKLRKKLDNFQMVKVAI